MTSYGSHGTQAAARDQLRFTWNPTAAQWRGELFTPQVVPASKFVTSAAAGPTTLAAGDITGSAFCCYATTNAAPGTVTTRTATLMYADDAAAAIGKTWMVLFTNTGAGTMTLAGGTGVTVTGTATVATATTRLFCATFNSATTLTLQSVSIGSIA